MGKSADSPDYKGAAQQQETASHQGTSGPFGSSSWSQGPNGQWTQNQSFSGGLGDAAKSAMAQLGSQGAADFSGLPGLDYGQAAGQKAYDAAYGQSASRLACA